MTLLSSVRQLAGRMIRAALGEKELYWELALHPGAIRQSMLAVLIVAAAWGIGAAAGDVMDGNVGDAIGAFLVTGLWGLLFWFPFSGFAFWITRLAARVYDDEVAPVTYLQFMRNVGFVSTPGILLILAPIPFVGEAAALLAFIWTAMAATVAIRHTLEAPLGLAIMGAFGGMTLGLLVSVFARVYLLA